MILSDIWVEYLSDKTIDNTSSMSASILPGFCYLISYDGGYTYVDLEPDDDNTYSFALPSNLPVFIKAYVDNETKQKLLSNQNTLKIFIKIGDQSLLENGIEITYEGDILFDNDKIQIDKQNIISNNNYYEVTYGYENNEEMR